MKLHISDINQLLLHIGSAADTYGNEVYVVGGFVRDWVLNDRFGYSIPETREIDFTVINGGLSFAHRIAESLGVSHIVTFERFGTCLVPYNDFKLEFVQARAEEYDPSSRKPIVYQAGDLYTELARRDFTVNALARRITANGLGEIIDFFNGIDDLQKKLLRTPLEPYKTFDDDPLRMIRAIRFASRFGFSIDGSALRAIKKTCNRIAIVSQERITDEIVKIMMTDTPSIGLKLLLKTGLLELLFPELHRLIGVDQRNSYHHKDVWIHTLKVVDNTASVSQKLPLRLAALFHDIAKPDTKRFVENTGWTFHGHEMLGAIMMEAIIRRLRLPIELIPYLQKLIRLHLRPINLSVEGVTDSAIRRLIVNAGKDLEDLLILCRADITSGNPLRVKQHLKNFDFVERRMKEVEETDKLRAFKSPVNGNEIMEAFGLSPSRIVGTLKTMIEEAILDGIIPNEHDAAFAYLLKIKDDVIKSK
jgi:putative nucleotidyltransferase with HDIG domain